MEELLHELADAELGKQVMDTVGVAVTKCNTFIRQPKNKHNADWWETERNGNLFCLQEKSMSYVTTCHGVLLRRNTMWLALLTARWNKRIIWMTLTLFQSCII